MTLSLEYVAGFFDGEGCVNFSKCRASVFPRVLVVNTDIAILMELQAQFGGDVRPLSGRQEHWKQGYMWRLSWGRAVAFCEAIRPFVRVKARQIEAVLEWAHHSPGKGGKWDQGKLIDLTARVREMNRRGIALSEQREADRKRK